MEEGWSFYPAGYLLHSTLKPGLGNKSYARMLPWVKLLNGIMQDNVKLLSIPNTFSLSFLRSAANISVQVGISRPNFLIRMVSNCQMSIETKIKTGAIMRERHRKVVAPGLRLMDWIIGVGKQLEGQQPAGGWCYVMWIIQSKCCLNFQDCQLPVSHVTSRVNFTPLQRIERV